MIYKAGSSNLFKGSIVAGEFSITNRTIPPIKGALIRFFKDFTYYH